MPLDEYREYLYGRGLRDETVRQYTAKLRFAVAWAADHGVDLHDAAPSTLRELADEFPNSHSSRRHLRTALMYWWQLEDVEGWPDAIVVPKKPPPRPRALTVEDADRLAVTARAWWPEGSVVMLGLYAGFRRSEIAAARWEWFAGWKWVSIMGKGGRTRHVPVHPDLRSWLRQRATASGYLFPGEGRRAHITPATVNNWFDRVAAAADVDATPHQLRHTFAQTIYDQTRDVYLVQKLLGHANVETTMRYVGVSERATEDAVLAMRSFGAPNRLKLA